MSMSVQSENDDGVDTDSLPYNDDNGVSTNRNEGMKTVVHYRVELPPCFHGDGKDKESFTLWKKKT